MTNRTPDTLKEAKTRLDQSIFDINGPPFKNSDNPKVARIARELTDVLTELKGHIDMASRKTEAGRRDTLGQVQQLRDALIRLSDAPGMLAIKESTLTQQEGMTDIIIRNPTTVSRSAKVMVPAARIKLEKMGLRFDATAPWSPDTLSNERCLIVMAQLVTDDDPQPNIIKAIAKKGVNDYNTFRDALASDNSHVGTSPLGDMARQAKRDKTQGEALYKTFLQFKTAYDTLTNSEEFGQLRNLKSHSQQLAAYLTAVENNTPLLPSLDKIEQKILRKLGILEMTYNITEDAEAGAARLYENRPLTEALLIDMSIAAHAAATPNVIGCMRSAFASKAWIYPPRKMPNRLQALCEESEQWSPASGNSRQDAEQKQTISVSKTIEAYPSPRVSQVSHLLDTRSCATDTTRGQYPRHGQDLDHLFWISKEGFRIPIR